MSCSCKSGRYAAVVVVRKQGQKFADFLGIDGTGDRLIPMRGERRLTDLQVPEHLHMHEPSYITGAIRIYAAECADYDHEVDHFAVACLKKRGSTWVIESFVPVSLEEARQPLCLQEV